MTYQEVEDIESIQKIPKRLYSFESVFGNLSRKASSGPAGPT